MCTCEEMERGTHTHRASKLGPVERWWTQDGKLRITVQDPRRIWKTDTFIVFHLFISYSVTFVTTCHLTACFTSLWTSVSVSISVLHVMSTRFCWYLPIFVTLPKRFHTHIPRHTPWKTHTHVWSTHKRNGDKSGTGTWMGGAEQRLFLKTKA